MLSAPLSALCSRLSLLHHPSQLLSVPPRRLHTALPQQSASLYPQVPLIAIMATGGGTRSMTAMYGHLLGLQKLNLLNCASYITGLSGATW